MKKKYLQISNIILLTILFVIAIHENYFTKSRNFFLNKNIKLTDYKNNPSYNSQLSIYPFYKKKASVVMLGNSITQRVNWNELLDRDDIINRGIGNDITEGFLSRIESVFYVEPSICFIMGGINDLLRNKTPDEVVQNIKLISQKLENRQISPQIQSILYVAKNYPKAKIINDKVMLTNTLLKEMCAENGFDFIDLNKVLAPNYYLKAEYSLDGIHLKGLGYEQWNLIIKPIIESKIY